MAFYPVKYPLTPDILARLGNASSASADPVRYFLMPLMLPIGQEIFMLLKVIMSVSVYGSKQLSKPVEMS